MTTAAESPLQLFGHCFRAPVDLVTAVFISMTLWINSEMKTVYFIRLYWTQALLLALNRSPWLGKLTLNPSHMHIHVMGPWRPIHTNPTNCGTETFPLVHFHLDRVMVLEFLH
jgi:hypothetical protein